MLEDVLTEQAADAAEKLAKHTAAAVDNLTSETTAKSLSNIQHVYSLETNNITIIRPPGTVVPDGLLFYRRCFFFFRQPNLRGPSADRRETLPHHRNLAAIAG